MPPHCFSPIAVQFVWLKFKSTRPLVVKDFVTNFVHLELLLAVFPSVTTFDFPRYTSPSALNSAPGPQALSTSFVSLGSTYKATACHGFAGSVGGERESEASFPAPLGKLTWPRNCCRQSSQLRSLMC